MVAFSGGVDSVAVLDFLSRNHEVVALFVNHGTETSQNAREFTNEFCLERGISYECHNIPPATKKSSLEEYWRKERYKIFHSQNLPVVTAHHLDDVIETYILSFSRHKPAIIPFKNKNVIRPFRLTKKKDFILWCEKKGLSWTEDKTNQDTSLSQRNYIRHEVVKHFYRLNPGFDKIVRKKVLQSQN